MRTPSHFSAYTSLSSYVNVNEPGFKSIFCFLPLLHGEARVLSTGKDNVDCDLCLKL